MEEAPITKDKLTKGKHKKLIFYGVEALRNEDSKKQQPVCFFRLSLINTWTGSDMI